MDGSFFSSHVLSKISLTLDSQPGVAMVTWPAMDFSQSKRSLDISCGRMATESQASSLAAEGAAAAVVAGGRPHGVMIGGVELTGHQARSQAAERGAHLVGSPWGTTCPTWPGSGTARRTGWRGSPHSSGCAGYRPPRLLGLVVPGNAEQVDGVDVPQAGMGQLFLDFLRDEIRILHLRDGRDDDVVFLAFSMLCFRPSLLMRRSIIALPPVFTSVKNIACIWKCKMFGSCRRIL